MFQHRLEIDCGAIKYIDSGFRLCAGSVPLCLILISNYFNVILCGSVLSMIY